jgi:hypothetical protein
VTDSNSSQPVDGDELVNSGKPWTRSEIDYLVRARHHGATVMELAAYLKRDGDEVDAKCDFVGM